MRRFANPIPVAFAAILAVCAGAHATDAPEPSVLTWARDAARFIEEGVCDLGETTLARARELERHQDRPWGVEAYVNACAGVSGRSGIGSRWCRPLLMPAIGIVRSAAGLAYLRRQCVDGDPVRVGFWFRKAALATVGAPHAERTRLYRAVFGEAPLPAALLDELDWVSAVEAGDARTQYEAALRLRRGDDGVRDPAAALDWIERAAEKGLPEAQYEHGLSFFRGRYPEPEPIMGFTWLTSAAEAGHVPAQVDLARRHAEDDGLHQSDALAYYWYRRARENGASVEDALGRVERRLGDFTRAMVEEWLMRPADAPVP